MPIIVEPSYHISLDEAATWVVKPDMLVRHDEHTFVRLRTWDKNLITIITNIAGVELPSKSRPSLAGCPGYNALKSLRNSMMSAGEEDSNTASALFGREAAINLKVKPARISLAQMAQLRANPQVMEVPINNASRGQFTALILRPGHPNEDVSVLLDSETLDHVFTFIAEQGVSSEDLLSKRQYGSDHGPGVFSNGSAGLMRKNDVDACDDGAECEEPLAKKSKFKTINPKSKQAKLSDMFGRASAHALDEPTDVSKADEATEVS